jgi:hypothetical protein
MVKYSNLWYKTIPMVGTELTLKELLPDPYPNDPTNPMNLLAGYVRLAIREAEIVQTPVQKEPEVHFDELTLVMLDTLTGYDVANEIDRLIEHVEEKEASSQSEKRKDNFRQIGRAAHWLSDLYQQPALQPVQKAKKSPVAGNHPFRGQPEPMPGLGHHASGGGRFTDVD